MAVSAGQIQGVQQAGPPAVPAGPPVELLAPKDVFRALGSREAGLTSVEARERLERFGPNTIEAKRGTPLVLRFLANFTHLMAMLLWVAGIVALVAQMPQLAVAIWLVNLINGSFSFWQEFRAERATEALQRLLPTTTRVLRDGAEARVEAAGLVPGDVILLEEGDHVPADARLVRASLLAVDQSTLTGESRPVRRAAEAAVGEHRAKADLPNLVFAGTNVSSGTGTAVVLATGMRTEFGRIASLTQSVHAGLSPLQREIGVVTKVVTLIAVVAGAAFFALSTAVAGMRLAEGFIFALGMVVAFVPEGLLPTVTLSLAIGVQRMARRNALIKRLSSVETLGCTSVICTDKTGTLTQNEMTVRELWVGACACAVSGIGYAPGGEIRPQTGELVNAGDLRDFLTAAGLCTNARLLAPNGEAAHWTVLGDPTEAALRVLAAKGGLDLAAEEARLPRERELPFDSRRKRMSTVHRLGRARTAFVKGAPREVLALCSSLRLNGVDVPLDEAERERILAANDAYARSGLRVLAVASRVLPRDLRDFGAESVERELTFLGLAAMMDPPRPEVEAAVEKCHRAGIRVVMITGDYGLTAESIARRIGIVHGEHPRVVSGEELEAMDDAVLREALDDEVIFARVAPEQKLRVVTALRALGQVVAVTGDGVNDAPALKQADIGVAMGIAGTDVAKEAADMILTDDNFASIVAAVEEGRTVYANIRKFATYIFTSNAPEAVPFILFALSGGRIPLALTVMQILSVDLGTDMLPAVALGSESSEEGVMDRPPRKLSDHLITPALLARAYLFLGPLQSAAAMAAFYFAYWTSGFAGQFIDLPGEGSLYQSATAMTLAATVFTQVGNVFAQRTERSSIFRVGFFSNRLVLVGILVELLLIALLVYAPFLQAVFGTAAFPLSYWAFLLALSPTLLVADELRKWALRRARPRR